MKRKKKFVIIIGILLAVGVIGVLFFIIGSREIAKVKTEEPSLASSVEGVGDIKLSPKEEIMPEVTKPEETKPEETIENTVEVPMKPETQYIYPAGQVIDKKEIVFDELVKYFQGHEISGEVYARINGKSYVENSDITLSQLRYLTVLHYNYNHEIQAGELIVNEELADDFANIFLQLFESGYEINSMRLIDDFWMGDGIASDTESIKNNNTSAFCYRQIFGGSGLSNHAKGCAIDINPMENPYVSYSNGEPVWFPEYSKDYIERKPSEPHVITDEDLCYEIFTEYGFTWGGDWETPKDYQHFERVM